MLPITEKFLTSRRNRPALRDRKYYTLRKLKGVVAHWTANTGRGADAMANRNYFNNTDRFASAHYIVDDHSIVQCLPDHEVAYHVGGRYYRPIGEMIREDGLTPNYFLIGFEMCVNSDGDWDKTYRHSVELAQHLLNKYNFTVNDLFRHYDITGKYCPRMMIDEAPWQAFKEAVNEGLKFRLSSPVKRGEVNVSWLNVREGTSTRYRIVDVLKKSEEVEIYETVGNWHRIGVNKWVHKHYINITFESKRGLITVSDPDGLNVRSGPGTDHPVMEVLHDGEMVRISNLEGKWYEIAPARWVHSAFVQEIQDRVGRVIASRFLNVRKGPGTQHDRVRLLQHDSLVTVHEIRDGWYRIGEDEWSYGVFIELLE